MAKANALPLLESKGQTTFHNLVAFLRALNLENLLSQLEMGALLKKKFAKSSNEVVSGMDTALRHHNRCVMKIDSNTADDAVLAELGKRLARLRLDRNLSQIQLAREAGTSKPTLQRLESGAVATQPSGFFRVCRTLGLLEDGREVAAFQYDREFAASGCMNFRGCRETRFTACQG